MTKLMRVKGNYCSLLWPDDFPGPDRGRGLEGYVVDLDAPLERDVFCAGQEWKLEPAPEGAEPTPIDNPVAKVRIRQALAAADPQPPAPPPPPSGVAWKKGTVRA